MRWPRLRLRIPRPSWRRLTGGRALPWALFVVTAAVAMFNWYQWRGLRNDAHDREVVASVSRDFLTTLFNFDSGTIDQTVVKLRGYAVDPFASEVAQDFSATRIQQIKSAKVVSRSTIRSVFVEDVGGTAASAFGVVDETITNASTPTPRTDVVRVDLGLIDTTGGWKIDRVTLLTSLGTGNAPSG